MGGGDDRDCGPKRGRRQRDVITAVHAVLYSDLLNGAGERLFEDAWAHSLHRGQVAGEGDRNLPDILPGASTRRTACRLHAS